MARKVNRRDEKNLVILLRRALEERVLPEGEMLEKSVGLAAVEASLATRLGEMEEWLESVKKILATQKFSKPALTKLDRLRELIRELEVVALYGAHMLVRQKMENRQFRLKLGEEKK